MYRIALAGHAFDKHSGIDPSHSVMRLCHVAQDALLRLAGLGVDRDHLAARITLEDGEAQPLPDLEGPPDQLVLPVRPVLRPVGIEVGPEAATVDRHGELVPEPSGRGVAEQRDRPAVVEAALAEPERTGIPGAPLHHSLELGRAQRQGPAIRRRDVDLEGALGGKYRIDAGRHLEGFLDIRGQGRGSALTEVRAEQDQILLLAPGVPGEALGPRRADESKSAVAHQPGKADEGLRHVLARHALDGVATDGLDGADPFHVYPRMTSGEPPLIRRRRSSAGCSRPWPRPRPARPPGLRTVRPTPHSRP